MRSCSKYCNSWLQQHWQQPKLLGWCLWPFSILFRMLAAVRKFIYQRLAYRAKVPVIIVGNITVGGTGKTPTVIYLAHLLQQHGYNPGIVTRGYKSKTTEVTEVFANSKPNIVGDEAVLLAQHANCKVVIAKSRVAGVKHIQDQVDVIICDDGLQHYRLARDIEIALVDGDKQFGNGYCLPMGPLRELPSRLASVNLVLVNGKDLSLQPVQELRGNGATVHAIAGIGNPQRFFNMLRGAGFNVIEHAFPDHYQYTAKDLKFADQHPILMTAKDAVKCTDFGIPLQVIHVRAEIATQFVQDLLALLKEKQYARSKST